MEIIKYDRQKAVEYARKWALGRNPAFYDFDDIGGDCTNYASQCIYAGSGIMNYTPVYGWFYINANNRTASWTGVEYLYNFLMNNKGVAPFAKTVNKDEIQLGDIVQLGHRTGGFYHSPVVTGFDGGEILVSAHTYDVLDVPLSSYTFGAIRYIHILGVRK